LYIGGQFWDGRAATHTEQVKGPFLNPVEMAMDNEAAVLAAMIDGNNPNAKAYRKLFKKVYGVDLARLDLNEPIRVNTAYELVAEAIAAFEQTGFFRPFTSKYDYYLAGKAELSCPGGKGSRPVQRQSPVPSLPSRRP
jgi:cytochrome c peroxidase